MPSLSFGDDSVIPYSTGVVINSMDITNIQKERSVFGLHTDTYHKSLYEMYSTINNCVYRTMEYALGLTHDLYKKWLDFKSTIGDDYTKYIDTMRNNYIGKSIHYGNILKKEPDEDYSTTDIDYYQSFKYFLLSFLASSTYSDLSMCINQKDYLNTVFDLNNELENEFGNNFNDYNIHFKIGCTHNEFPMFKDDMTSLTNLENLDKIAFVVVPELKQIQMFIDQYQNSVITFSQHIYFDINRLIISFINLYDPSRLPEYLEDGEQDKKQYVLNGLDKFKTLSETITRRIILELFDNYENTHENWGSFISKINKHYSSALKNDDISSLVKKLSYYNMVCPETILNSLIDNERAVSNNPIIIDMEGFNGLLNNIYNSNYTIDVNYVSLIGKSLICKLFSKAFTTSVAHYLYYDGSGKEVVLNGYTRDFYQKYSKTELLEDTSKISDYNIRDFFQSIIKDDIGFDRRPYGTKLGNGEYAYFMYSKSLRNIWFDFASYFYAVTNIIFMNSVCKEKIKNSVNVTTSVDKKISEMMFALYNTLKILYQGDGISYSLTYDYSYSDFIPIYRLINELSNIITTSRSKKFYSRTNIDSLICEYYKRKHKNNSIIPQNIIKFNTKYIKYVDDENYTIRPEFITKVIDNLLNNSIVNGIIPINVD